MDGSGHRILINQRDNLYLTGATSKYFILSCYYTYFLCELERVYSGTNMYLNDLKCVVFGRFGCGL